MKSTLRTTAWKFAAFILVCALGTFGLVMVFGELRFDKRTAYTATFTNVTGLEEGNFVRIAGVEVGKVQHISINPDTTVQVAFATDPTVMLTDGTRAAIRYDDVIGGRYLELLEGAGGTARLTAGRNIPASRTEPALDLDALIGGFRPLFRALDPDQVNTLSTQLIKAFQGQGVTIGSFLAQAAAVTNTLADRDVLIGEVIDNLTKVTGTLADHSDQFAKGLDALSGLIKGLAARGGDISGAIANIDGAAGSIADLLNQARQPLKEVVAQTDRAAGIVVADHDYFDDLLNTLPDSYRLLARQGLYGDYFSFYLCDLVLKLNGKGGQPVYVKLAGQTSGRCTPK